MRYSRLFGKTQKTPLKDMKFNSHKLLYQGGFVRELSAGRYEFLPLGMRVFVKMVSLINNEMERIGSQRISIPLLQPIEFWQKSNRDKAWGGLLMKVKDARGAEFALSATGEGVITEMVTAEKPTYKDLPVIVHQFIDKFRDEMRPRGGLLRVREFVMKDAYSYHATEKDFMKTYENFYKAYSAICEKLGLEYYPVIADSGALGGDYCHEFQVPCEAGEDQIVKCSACDYAANIEKAEFEREEVNKNEEVRAMEIIDQPWEKARTIEEMVEFFGRPANNMIKTVAYRKPDGNLVLAVVTGNLEVSPAKLAAAVGVSELEKAAPEDLARIGATSGALHAWGYEEHRDKITYVADLSIVKARNLYGGYKTETTDPKYVNYDRDFKADIEADVAEAYSGGKCVKCGGALELIRTVEFGHVFKYDHFYTKHHSGYFTDSDGQQKLMYMGAYGIGIGRAIAITVEKHNDEKGIIWPESVAPFRVHLIGLNLENELVRKRSEEVYENLMNQGVEVLYDDRPDASAGQKFADADLIGIPYRAVVSSKTGEQVEVKRRQEQESRLMVLEEFIKTVLC